MGLVHSIYDYSNGVLKKIGSHFRDLSVSCVTSVASQ